MTIIEKWEKENSALDSYLVFQRMFFRIEMENNGELWMYSVLLQITMPSYSFKY